MTLIDDAQSIDEQIRFHEEEIQRIQDQKEQVDRKEEGFQAINAVIFQQLDEYGITWNEFLARQSVVLGDFLTGEALKTCPDLSKRLMNFYLKLDEQEKRRRAQKLRPKSAAKLEPGKYINPMTLETIEKKTRTPQGLNAWVAEKGIGEVRGWLVSE